MPTVRFIIKLLLNEIRDEKSLHPFVNHVSPWLQIRESKMNKCLSIDVFVPLILMILINNEIMIIAYYDTSFKNRNIKAQSVDNFVLNWTKCWTWPVLPSNTLPSNTLSQKPLRTVRIEPDFPGWRCAWIDTWRRRIWNRPTTGSTSKFCKLDFERRWTDSFDVIQFRRWPVEKGEKIVVESLS